MDRENALLNLAPDSPIKSAGLSRMPGVGDSNKGLGYNSDVGSPMSIGSPADISMGVALKLKARALTPAQFEDKESSSSEEEEEDIDAPTKSAQDTQQ